MAASMSMPRLVWVGEEKKLLSEVGGEGERLSRWGCEDALCCLSTVGAVRSRSRRGVLGAEGVRRCRALRVESPRTKDCLRGWSVRRDRWEPGDGGPSAG